MVYAQPIRRPRIRLINPNCALSTITMPELVRQMTFSRKAIFAPVGLTVCAAVVPHHWDVEIIDGIPPMERHLPLGEGSVDTGQLADLVRGVPWSVTICAHTSPLKAAREAMEFVGGRV